MSPGMVAAHWNLVRTEDGPPVQKVADPWPSLHCSLKLRQGYLQLQATVAQLKIQ